MSSLTVLPGNRCTRGQGAGNSHWLVPDVEEEDGVWEGRLVLDGELRVLHLALDLRRRHPQRHHHHQQQSCGSCHIMLPTGGIHSGLLGRLPTRLAAKVVACPGMGATRMTPSLTTARNL